MSGDQLPLSRPADELLGDLRNEVTRLEHEQARFDDLPVAGRLRTRQDYEVRIRIRRELLALLEDARPGAGK